MSTLSAAQADDYAAALYRAERERNQIAALSETHPDLTMEDAYAVQAAWVDRKQADGDERIGYKIGLTSKVMQRAMRIDVPDYGVLLASMHFDNHAEIEAARFTDPRIEVELAFVLKERLFGEDVGIDDVLAATDYVVPALELISARSYRINPDTGYVRTVYDTIADNAANGGLVCSSEHFDPAALDLPWCGAILRKNGEVEETGLAAGVMGHPASGIRWIAKRFAAHGVGLEPGQILLAGSFTAPVPVIAGDRIEVDYGPLGTVSCAFI